jgi:SAM-dependent methyltransferase
MAAPGDAPRIRCFTPLRTRLFRRALARALAGCRSVLDVGCGAGSPLADFAAGRFTVGVDLSMPDLAAARRAGTHAALVRADARALAAVFRPASVDAVVALDLIEHLERAEALALLDALARVARRRIVVFTPNGFVPQPPAPENPHQAHRSGFDVAELRARGFRVRGMLGLRPLLGPFAEPRWRPAVLWRRAADATAPLVHFAPRVAFALLAVKDV